MLTTSGVGHLFFDMFAFYCHKGQPETHGVFGVQATAIPDLVDIYLSVLKL